MRACKFVTDDGLSVDLEGTLADVGGDPHGALRWVFAAPDKNAFTSFVRLWDLPDDLSGQAMRYVALAPMRLAGTIRLGERGKTSADIPSTAAPKAAGWWRRPGSTAALAIGARPLAT